MLSALLYDPFLNFPHHPSALYPFSSSNILPSVLPFPHSQYSLLPSRLRDSQTIPDMFKPKKMQAPVLMRSEREHKPRLGTSEKSKGEEHPTAAKPYAGRGGMKKMLAKRKLEEQEEQVEQVG